MGERRKSKRFPEKKRAVINCYIKYGSFVYEEKTASISELSVDGTRLLTYQELSPGTECKISLDLAGSKQIVQLWARVIWVEKTRRSDEYKIGIEFIHTEESRAQLKKHLYGEADAIP
jgi:hypothetical protein